MGKIQYCILCGAQNRINDKFCHKCGESLDQKDDNLQNYAKEKITDEIKGKAADGLLDMLKPYIALMAQARLSNTPIIPTAAAMPIQYTISI